MLHPYPPLLPRRVPRHYARVEAEAVLCPVARLVAAEASVAVQHLAFVAGSTCLVCLTADVAITLGLVLATMWTPGAPSTCWSPHPSSSPKRATAPPCTTAFRRRQQAQRWRLPHDLALPLASQSPPRWRAPQSQGVSIVSTI